MDATDERLVHGTRRPPDRPTARLLRLFRPPYIPPMPTLTHAPITAPTGTTLSCKGWHQEAALRMLMNNLDPGGRRAARGADRLRRGREGGAELGVLRADRRHAPAAGERRDAPGPERQAGGRVPDARGGAARAHRQRAPRAALGDVGRVPPARRAGAHHVRPDDGRLVDLHRHPGHPAGHLRDLRRMRAPALRRDARGPAGGHRRPGRDGRRAAARGDDERRGVPGGGRRRIPHPAPGRDPLLRPARARSGCRAPGPGRRPRRGAGRSRSGWSATSPRCCRSWCGGAWCPDVLTDQTSAHDLRVGYIPAGLSLEDAAALRERDPAAYEQRVLDSMVAHVRAMLALQGRGAVTFDYGNNLRGQVADHRGMAEAFEIPGFVPAFIRPLFCRGAGPFRWAALSGDPADIAVTDRAVLETFPGEGGAGALDPPGAGAGPVPGPAGPDLLARVRRAGGDGPALQLAGEARQGPARRSSSGAIISTPARWRRPTARPRG